MKKLLLVLALLAITTLSYGSNQTASKPISISVSVQHATKLNWVETTGNYTISGFYVYRSTVSGSGYTKVTSNLVTSTTYTDTSVVSGTTYYYVVTCYDAVSKKESANSSEVKAVIPVP